MSEKLEEAFSAFVDLVKGGLYILPPEPNTLGQLDRDFSALQRDELQIVGQVQDDGSLDSGDSAHRTGVLAFCNSKKDQGLLPLFENDGLMHRHPTHEPWNNWKNSSRDQLVGYVSGCWRGGRTDIAARLLSAHENRNPIFTCQNTEADYPGTVKDPPIGDPIGPHTAMYLRICAGVESAHLDPAGQFSLQLAIQFSDKGIDKEPNQLLLHSIVCGRLKFFCEQYPDYADRLRYYWSGWRQQPQIAEALIAVVGLELKRYEGQALSGLLPEQTIKFLSDLNVQEEITNLDPAHHAAMALSFAQAVQSDALAPAKKALAVANAAVVVGQQAHAAAKEAVDDILPPGIPSPIPPILVPPVPDIPDPSKIKIPKPKKPKWL